MNQPNMLTCTCPHAPSLSHIRTRTGAYYYDDDDAEGLLSGGVGDLNLFNKDSKGVLKKHAAVPSENYNAFITWCVFGGLVYTQAYKRAREACDGRL